MPNSHLVSLVLPEVGDGPLSIVLDGRPDDFSALEPGMAASIARSRVQVGRLQITLDTAKLWEPRPVWAELRARRDLVAKRLSFLQTLARRHSPQGSLLELLGDQPRTGRVGSPFGRAQSGGSPLAAIDAHATLAQEAAEVLGKGWEGDAALLRVGATRLAGLGGGLTPAGDDFLTGVMVWAWLAHPTPGTVCRHLLEAAAPRTTILSAAFLRAAAAGECSVVWHRLLAVLANEKEQRLTQAVREVLAYGQTSGADALAGFLWMGLRPARD
jgi:hypothetical protein